MVATVHFKSGCNSLQKRVAMDPPPFGAQPHVTSPTHKSDNVYLVKIRNSATLQLDLKYAIT